MLPGAIDASGVSSSGLVRDLAPTPKAKSGPSFAELATSVLDKANAAQNEADTQAKALAAGEGDVVESLLALSQADLSLRFVVSLRNRALDAYNEIMRLQL